MDERLSSIRAELQTGTVSPHALVLLFNTASDADHAGDLATLEETRELARAIGRTVEEPLRAEAERLAAICEQSLVGVRERRAGVNEPASGVIVCPECGNELLADALRCRRCGRRFF